MIENFRPAGFVSQHRLLPEPAGSAFFFCFKDNDLLLSSAGALPSWEELKPLRDMKMPELYCFGTLDGTPCILLRLPEDLALPAALQWRGIRACHGILSEPLFRIAGLARQLQYWRITHLHCGQCGAPTQDKQDERAKICPSCQRISYPQLYPCVIVLVTRGPELLLARSPHFPPGVYSTLAGFIEPGESAENAVLREVHEETGIVVQKISYRWSQPWPFPNSLMLGFLAEYASGELVIEPREIEDAQWFHRERLPALPSALSISRWLIEESIAPT